MNGQSLHPLECFARQGMYLRGSRCFRAEVETWLVLLPNYRRQLRVNARLGKLGNCGSPLIAFPLRLTFGLRNFAKVMHEAGVALVSPLALPRCKRVVLKSVELGADERVSALHLVIEELKGQLRVHRLDPERESSKFDRHGVEVHTVEAGLDDMAL